MDTQLFADRLPGAFVGPLTDGVPADDRLREIAETVAGFTTPAELATLRLAGELLPEGEAYLEVGTFKGRSIVAALLDAPDRDFVAVENFQEFGMVGADARAELTRNLAGRTEGRRFRLVDGDCFAVLARPDAVGAPVGVYFYDGAHTGLAHHLALAVVEPLLADEALVLVDDASWPMVRRATLRWVARNPGWSVLVDVPAAVQDDERWANGLLVLRFQRRGAQRRIRPADQLRRRFQVHVRGPATSLVWHSLHRWPRLVPVAKAVVPKRSRVVPAHDGQDDRAGRG